MFLAAHAHYQNQETVKIFNPYMHEVGSNINTYVNIYYVNKHLSLLSGL